MFGQEDPWKFEGKAKCRTMHTRCTNSKPKRRKQAHGCWWAAMGPGSVRT